MTELSQLPRFPDEAKEAAEEKRLIVFLGAGLSCAAGLMEWNDLKNQIIEQYSPASNSANNIKDQLRKMKFYDFFTKIRLAGERNYKSCLANALKITPQVNLDAYKRWLKIINTWEPKSIVTTNVDPLLRYHGGFNVIFPRKSGHKEELGLG